MRSLSECRLAGEKGVGSDEYLDRLGAMRKRHHSKCCFNGENDWLPCLSVDFDKDGVLHGMFTVGEKHQGYDGRVHGGLIAAIVDASMAQCCMGHGVAGYTADLSVRYRKPVQSGTSVVVRTAITGVRAGVLYSLVCRMEQDGKEVVTGLGRFYRFA